MSGRCGGGPHTSGPVPWSWWGVKDHPLSRVSPSPPAGCADHRDHRYASSRACPDDLRREARIINQMIRADHPSEPAGRPLHNVWVDRGEKNDRGRDGKRGGVRIRGL